MNITNITLQKKGDSWNCGVYCAQYLKTIIKSEDWRLDLKFKNTAADLKRIRCEMYSALE